jgi:hypothetical protein
VRPPGCRQAASCGVWLSGIFTSEGGDVLGGIDVVPEAHDLLLLVKRPEMELLIAKRAAPDRPTPLATSPALSGDSTTFRLTLADWAAAW